MKVRGYAWAAAFAIALAGWVSTAPNLPGELIFDDIDAIRSNRSLRTLDASAFVATPQSPTAARPVANYSLALDYAIGGLEAYQYRRTNLLLHILNALLAWRVLSRLFRATRMPAPISQRAELLSVCTALLWVVHPLPLEVVLYGTQRTEVLMASGWMLMLYGALRAIEAPARAGRWTLVAVAGCTLGVLCKETIAVALPLLLALDRAFFTGTFRDALRQRFRLYLALCLPYGWTLWTQLHAPWSASVAGPSIAYAKAQGEVVLGYFAKAFWPSPILLDYGVLKAMTPGWGGLIALSVIVAASSFAALRFPRAGYPMAWVLALLAPTSTFITLYTEPGAERRMYLPLLAFCACASLAVVLGLARALRGREARYAPHFATAVVASMTLALAAMRLDQGQYYASHLAFWSGAIEQLPSNARAHYNLSEILRNRVETDAAIETLRRGGSLDAAALKLLTNLQEVRTMAPSWAQALHDAETAVARAPSDVPARLALSKALLQQGRLREAFVQIQEAERIDPGHPALKDDPAAKRLRELFAMQQ